MLVYVHMYIYTILMYEYMYMCVKICDVRVLSFILKVFSVNMFVLFRVKFEEKSTTTICNSNV